MGYVLLREEGKLRSDEAERLFKRRYRQNVEAKKGSYATGSERRKFQQSPSLELRFTWLWDRSHRIDGHRFCRPNFEIFGLREEPLPVNQRPFKLSQIKKASWGMGPKCGCIVVILIEER